jgi:hypothetical protein
MACSSIVAERFELPSPTSRLRISMLVSVRQSFMAAIRTVSFTSSKTLNETFQISSRYFSNFSTSLPWTRSDIAAQLASADMSARSWEYSYHGELSGDRKRVAGGRQL